MVFAACLSVLAGLNAQDLSGNWSATYDQNPAGKMLKDKVVAVVELRMDAATGTLYSTIKSLQNGFATTCQNCPAPNANKSTIGLDWIKGLKAVPGKPGEYEGGTGIDPQTGEVASEVRLKLVNATSILVTGKIAAKGGLLRTIKLSRQ